MLALRPCAHTDRRVFLAVDAAVVLAELDPARDAGRQSSDMRLSTASRGRVLCPLREDGPVDGALGSAAGWVRCRRGGGVGVVGTGMLSRSSSLLPVHFERVAVVFWHFAPDAQLASQHDVGPSVLLA
eukprot:365202-Chlamydomonas_euryale.AAC.7